jgi:hypothetical protein
MPDRRVWISLRLWATSELVWTDRGAFWAQSPVLPHAGLTCGQIVSWRYVCESVSVEHDGLGQGLVEAGRVFAVYCSLVTWSVLEAMLGTRSLVWFFLYDLLFRSADLR